MKADVLVMKHEEVSHMATRCAATRSAHLHIIPLKYESLSVVVPQAGNGRRVSRYKSFIKMFI